MEKGIDVKSLKADERALKALYIIKEDMDKPKNLRLSDVERDALSAVIINRSIVSFFFFAKYVLEFDLLTEQTHKRWADDLQKALRKGKKRIMRLKPRGTYKSTLYGVGFVLWLWGCCSPQLRLFYTSSNSLLLGEIADKLSQYIGNDKADTLFSYIFGITKDSGAKNTGDVFNIKGRSGKGYSLILRTSGGNTVGIHPNIIIVDDPCDANDRESEATRRQKERWFDSLTPLLVPFYDKKNGIEFESMFYIGTVWHMRDLTYYVQETNKRLPQNQKWDIEIESVCKEDGTSNYPEFFPDDKIASIKANISDIFFACQYLNKPLPEGMQIFELSKLHFLRPDQVQEFFLHAEKLCVFDPSLGKTYSDYPAAWWILFFKDEIIFYDAIDKKASLTLIVHQLAAKNKALGCRNMVFENNGIGLVDTNLSEAHRKIGWNMNYEPIHHYSNKEERILSCQPHLYSGAVKFMSDYKERYPEAMNQIVFYPVYGNDDFPDAMQMGIEYFTKARFKFVRYEELL